MRPDLSNKETLYAQECFKERSMCSSNHQAIQNKEDIEMLEKDDEEKPEHMSDEDDSLDGKPNHSYISLIANAILSSPDKRLVLSDIYSYVLDNFTYFRSKGPGWRNSIRHNLSLNECFVKVGRSPNGKGHYWAINPANFDDFSKGDFRRRRAQRRARRAMVLHDLPEHFYASLWYPPFIPSVTNGKHYASTLLTLSPHFTTPSSFLETPFYPHNNLCPASLTSYGRRRASYPLEISKQVEGEVKKVKRAFDVESLLKDDKPKTQVRSSSAESSNCCSFHSRLTDSTGCCGEKRPYSYPTVCHYSHYRDGVFPPVPTLFTGQYDEARKYPTKDELRRYRYTP